jgi:hypothetical protein
MKPKKEKTFKIRKLGNFLEIDGKWYFPKQHTKGKGEYIIFKEVDKNAVRGNIDFLVKTLKPYLDKGMILEDALCELKPRQLVRLTESLKTGKRPKVRNRFGCVEMEVDGTQIDVR